MSSVRRSENVLNEPERTDGDDPVGPVQLHARLRRLLAEQRVQGERDPFGNPILRVALELTRLVDRNELLEAELDQLVRMMTARAFARRAERMRAYLGEIDIAANEARLRRLIASLARPVADAAPLPFAEFKAIIETFHYGVVFTAHPTFSMPHALGCLLAKLAADRDDDGKRLTTAARDAIIEEAREASHRPPVVTLEDEFASALEAILHAQDAVDRLHTVTLEVAREIYPQEWISLTPRIVSLASWVGYDHDGRSDIGWADTLRMRLKSKLAQLTRQRDACAALLRRHHFSRTAPMLELAESLLTLATKQVEQQIEASEGADGKLTERSLLFARKLVQGRDHATTDMHRLLRMLTRALETAEEPDLALGLTVMRAALDTHGLGLTHTHFRLNSTQLHNAIRHQIGLDTAPGDPGRRRSYLNRINELLAHVEPVTVNLGSLLAEKASAKRMFMMIAQVAKHIDAVTPIRFLIAETENAFTLLVALYFARLFGIDHLIEISPLLETEDALHRGEALIDEALQSPHFRAYVEAIGRLCIQFGYSDSGRYIGQTAASFAIERLRLRLADLLARHGLTHVQVVLFNTHGESIGRGGHPSSLVDRLHYLAPPASRLAFRRHGIALKEESSFQGGDGYLPFLAQELAFATICRIAEATLAPAGDEATDDPIYGDAAFASEFFAVVRQEFGGLVDEPDYAALLGTFGGLADRAGSRPVQRQHEYRAALRDFGHPSQTRAIVNNTILQQLGMLANTIDGVGQAAAGHAERFRFMLQHSPRFRRTMAMVEAAMMCSDPDVLGAYIETFAPGMWLNRSGRTHNPVRREGLRIIAAQFETGNIHARLGNVFRCLHADYLSLRDALAEGAAAGIDARSAGPDAEDREEMALLHALRIAVLHRIYLLASHIPDFTPHQGMTRDDLLQRILHLDIESSVERLGEIFPRSDALTVAGLDFAEPATYARDVAQTYEQEHEAIFAPMATYFTLTRRIGAAITHRIGAIG